MEKEYIVTQEYGNDVYTHLIQSYKEKIESVLDNQETPLFLREFYAESPNWYTNQNIYHLIDTLVWLTYTDQEKENKLNEEIEEYFKD